MTRSMILFALVALSPLFADGLSPGRYRVEGTEPGWGGFTAEVEVAPGPAGSLRYAGPLRWADGTAGGLAGQATRVGKQLQIREDLVRGAGGLAGALGGTPTRTRSAELGDFVAQRAEARFAQSGRAARWRRLSRTARVRVMSFNVLGFKQDWLWRGRRVSRAIAAADPDLVCLQETVGITRGTSPQVKGLGRRAGGYRAVFEGFRKYSWVGPWMGNGVLSRWPVERVGREALPRGPRGLEDYPRGVTWVRVRHPSGVVLDVGSLHLHHRHDAPDRALRVDQVRAAASSGFGGGAAARLLVGDYNAQPGSPTLDAVTALGWRDLWPEAEPGSPGYSGSVLGAGSPKRIDYVLAAPASGTVLRATRGELVGPRTNGDSGKLISDHKAVVVDLTLDVPVGP